MTVPPGNAERPRCSQPPWRIGRASAWQSLARFPHKNRAPGRVFCWRGLRSERYCTPRVVISQQFSSERELWRSLPRRLHAVAVQRAPRPRREAISLPVCTPCGEARVGYGRRWYYLAEPSKLSSEGRAYQAPVDPLCLVVRPGEVPCRHSGSELHPPIGIEVATVLISRPSRISKPRPSPDGPALSVVERPP